MHSAGYHEKMIGRTYFGGDQVNQLNLVLYNTIKWPYQPKHSPSMNDQHFGVRAPKLLIDIYLYIVVVRCLCDF